MKNRAQGRVSALRYFMTVIAGAVLCLSSSSWGRDLHGRLGLGYNSQFANNVPSLSLKYGMTRDIAAALVAGVATTDPTNMVAAVKFFKNVFYETNLNFYFTVGGGLISGLSTTTLEGNTGAEFMTGFGSEFFIPGVESLGFSIEVGASMNNLSGSFVVKTMGVSFLNAGIHFYF